MSSLGMDTQAPCPLGSAAYTYGRTPRLCNHDLGGGHRHPQTSPSAATHALPKVRMVEADLGSGAEAQDYLCLSQNLFPLKLLFLKILIK